MILTNSRPRSSYASEQGIMRKGKPCSAGDCDWGDRWRRRGSRFGKSTYYLRGPLECGANADPASHCLTGTCITSVIRMNSPLGRWLLQES